MMIYIVEDDENIRQMESYALKNSGYEVREFAQAQEFWSACEEELPDILILDIMLPEEDGLSIIKKMRASSRLKGVPIIFVTAKSSEIDAVIGLDMGADDYITKPFGIMEFISRVKAVLRRTEAYVEKVFRLDDSIVLDDEKHSVTCEGTICELTYKEFELLKHLLINQGTVLSRDKLMDKVWGFDFNGESRTVDIHIGTLRQKLGECGTRIITIRNVGYKME